MYIVYDVYMRINIWIPDKLVKRIDENSKSLGMTRSEYMVMRALGEKKLEEISPDQFKVVTDPIIIEPKIPAKKIPEKKVFNAMLNKYI